jgi:hypothetical protein
MRMQYAWNYYSIRTHFGGYTMLFEVGTTTRRRVFKPTHMEFQDIPSIPRHGDHGDQKSLPPQGGKFHREDERDALRTRGWENETNSFSESHQSSLETQEIIIEDIAVIFVLTERCWHLLRKLGVVNLQHLSTMSWDEQCARNSKRLLLPLGSSRGMGNPVGDPVETCAWLVLLRLQVEQCWSYMSCNMP